ncbi:MAG: hypothetical protein A2428_03795 [Bdellovibrionales bacterium RIFOXYC1_FULL_54_43]|nr:MAG: hypothetical protein A2428_03795 [Bdellovibrionales bacterium RIFOXYC1_FULL_54_43]OFZ84084.1 MAG: hypothetical protein A2603_06210 [Bdellovibrionales bacterium RIFOXYD1_FULL_55_31]
MGIAEFRSDMQILSWREIDFGAVVLSGLVGGYAMALAGLWAGKIPGFVAFDIADFGRRYMVSDRPSAWFFGMASHLANSVAFVLVFACFIVPSFQQANSPHSAGLLAMGWSLFLATGLAGSLVSPLAGLGFMGRRGGIRFAATNILVHIVWGLVIWFIYVPTVPQLWQGH